MPGLRLPLQFTHPAEEHIATRRAAGLFDFSFMGCLELQGRGCIDYLHRLQTRNIARLSAGRIAYTLLLREDGTVLNDATVWCFGHGHYGLFIGRRSDLTYVLQGASEFEVVLEDRSDAHAVIALQGPRSREILSTTLDEPVPALAYFGFWSAKCCGSTCWIARMGYSGESGYEIVVPAAAGANLWERLRREGVRWGLSECGFTAMDSLRIEAGHILFTNELAQAVTPYELGLSRLVDYYPHDFIGLSSLKRLRWKNPQRRMVGLLLESPSLQNKAKADVSEARNLQTSACFSPISGQWLGLGYANTAVQPDSHWPGARLSLSNGARAVVARLPFYDPGKHIPRSTP